MSTTSLSPSPMTLALLWTVVFLIVSYEHQYNYNGEVETECVFAARVVMVEEDTLRPNTQSVRVLVNPACLEMEPVLVTFAATSSARSNDCDGQGNGTSYLLSPGESAILTANSEAFDPGEGQCNTVSSEGKSGEWQRCGGSSCNESSTITSSLDRWVCCGYLSCCDSGVSSASGCGSGLLWNVVSDEVTRLQERQTIRQWEEKDYRVDWSHL